MQISDREGVFKATEIQWTEMKLNKIKQKVFTRDSM